MAEKRETVKLWTPECVLDFANFCMTPRPSKTPGGKAKYSGTLLFDAAAQADPLFAKMKQAANATALTKWSAPEIQAMMAGGRFKNPFLNGDSYAVDYPHWAGKVVLRVSSTMKPGIVDRQVQPIVDELLIYSGIRVKATVNPFWYDTDGNRGVSFGLNNLQKIGEGPRLFDGGFARPEDDFQALDGDDLAAATSGVGSPEALF